MNLKLKIFILKIILADPVDAHVRASAPTQHPAHIHILSSEALPLLPSRPTQRAGHKSGGSLPGSPGLLLVCSTPGRPQEPLLPPIRTLERTWLFRELMLPGQTASWDCRPGGVALGTRVTW